VTNEETKTDSNTKAETNAANTSLEKDFRSKSSPFTKIDKSNNTNSNEEEKDILGEFSNLNLNGKPNRSGRPRKIKKKSSMKKSNTGKE
jgi:hypothetical protein